MNAEILRQCHSIGTNLTDNFINTLSRNKGMDLILSLIHISEIGVILRVSE